jgi:hypothetical protein
MNKLFALIITFQLLIYQSFAQTDTTRTDIFPFPVNPTEEPQSIVKPKKPIFGFLDKSTFTFLTDQDLFAKGKNEDRNYTMGVGILFSSSKTNESKILINKNYLILPWIRKKLDLDSLLGKGALNGTLKNYSFEIRASGFTPLDIGVKEVIIGDRPFGMALNIGSTRQNTINPSGNEDSKPRSYTTSFYLGFLGTRIGESVQSYIHSHHWAGSTRPVPLGWPNQISDSKYFPPVFLYRVNFIQPLILEKLSTNPNVSFFQMWGNAETNIGYYTNIAGGIGLRIGKINDRYFEGQNVCSPFNALATNNYNTKYKNWQFYFFSNSRIRLIGYNTLLQGRMLFDNSVYILKSSEISRFVFELDYGIAANYKGIRFAYVPFSMKTTEILTSFKRTHYYGTLFLSFSNL